MERHTVDTRPGESYRPASADSATPLAGVDSHLEDLRDAIEIALAKAKRQQQELAQLRDRADWLVRQMRLLRKTQ